MILATLILPGCVYRDIVSHLLPKGTDHEEAAFVFANTEQRGDDLLFRFAEWLPVLPMGFSIRSPFCLELSDETRGRVIKRAHDLNASIVEFHSHPQGPSRFSWSDKAGLLDFVPHVRWRLGGRPYGAVVVSPQACDAIAWNNAGTRIRVSKIVVGDRSISPTGWTFENWDVIDEYKTV